MKTWIEHVFCVMYHQTLETGQDGTRDGLCATKGFVGLVGLMNQVYMKCASEMGEYHEEGSKQHLQTEDSKRNTLETDWTSLRDQRG